MRVFGRLSPRNSRYSVARLTRIELCSGHHQHGAFGMARRQRRKAAAESPREPRRARRSLPASHAGGFEVDAGWRPSVRSGSALSLPRQGEAGRCPVRSRRPAQPANSDHRQRFPSLPPHDRRDAGG